MYQLKGYCISHSLALQLGERNEFKNDFFYNQLILVVPSKERRCSLWLHLFHYNELGAVQVHNWYKKSG